MNELPKIVRARLNAGSAGNHPDPDLLNAFAEQALVGAERQQVLTHLSGCADCREILALAADSAHATTVPPSVDTATGHFWFRWRVLRWGAAAACVVIVGSAVLMKHDLMMSRSAKTVAVQEEPVANKLAYQRAGGPSSSPAASTRQDADISPALELPSTKLTKRERAENARKSPVINALPAAPAAGALQKKTSGDFLAGGTTSAAVGRLSPAPAAASSNAATTPEQQEAKSLAVQSRNVSNLSVPPASEMVEVEAGAPTIATDSAAAVNSSDKKETPGRAKPSSAPTAVFDSMVEKGGAYGTATNATAAKARHQQLSSETALLSRWTISSDGQLQHSIDAGKNWQPVVVADHATFRALSANGPDIWVGGPAGLLYHSTDSGTHWKQVKPGAAGEILTGDIAAIEFTDIRQGKISTTTGEVWLTADAGQSWRKQP